MKHFGTRSVAIVVSVAVSMMLATASLADSPKYPLKGKVFTANVSAAGIPAGTTSVLVSKDTIGAGNVFVVQTWCVVSTSGYVAIFTNAGQGEGNFYLTSPASCSGGMCCHTFTPGYVVGEGVDLMKYANTDNGGCSVTGIIAKKAD